MSPYPSQPIESQVLGRDVSMSEFKSSQIQTFDGSINCHIFNNNYYFYYHMSDGFDPRYFHKF